MSDKNKIRREYIRGYDGAYMVTSDGNVLSFKRPSYHYTISPDGTRVREAVPTMMKPSQNKNPKNPDQPGYLSVNLRTPDNRTVKEYVGKLVYEAFGELPEDYWEEYKVDGKVRRVKDDYVISYKGSILDNSIDNLELVKKGTLTHETFSGSTRTKKTDVTKLPEGAKLFKEGVYDLAEILNLNALSAGSLPTRKRNTYKSNLWIYLNGKYHNISVIAGAGVLAEITGTMLIRVKRDELPERYLKYMDRTQVAKDVKWYSLPIAVYLMEEVYNNPRPSDKHGIGYRDFNFLNLTRENIIWETSSERMERMWEEMPMLQANFIKVAKKRNTDNPNKLTDLGEIDTLEKLYFVEKKKLKEIQRMLGKPDEYYSSMRYHLYKVREGLKLPLSKEVRQVLAHKSE